MNTDTTPPAPLGELSSERLRELIKGQNKLWHGRAVNDHEDILRLLNSELARREGLRGEPSRYCFTIANAIADAKVRLFGMADEVAERIRSGLAEPTPPAASNHDPATCPLGPKLCAECADVLGAIGPLPDLPPSGERT